jgi:hypothetical protein
LEPDIDVAVEPAGPLQPDGREPEETRETEQRNNEKGLSGGDRSDLKQRNSL